MDSTHITATSATDGITDITKAEFLAMWAKRTGSTLAEFEQMNIDAEPCDCGGFHCDGWLLVNKRTK